VVPALSVIVLRSNHTSGSSPALMSWKKRRSSVLPSVYCAIRSLPS
jgi:hypothetical protein